MDDDNALLGVVAAAATVVAVMAANESKKKRKRRQIWVRPMLQCRQQVGAYNLLMDELRSDDVQCTKASHECPTNTLTSY